MLALFAVFVELYQQGKDVYVLAGNHDWIGEEFVFSEAKMLLDSFAAPTSDSQSGGSLRFVTELEVHKIEGKRVVFLPYSPFLESDSVDAAREPSDDILIQEMREQSTILLGSSHKGEQMSGRVNTVLLDVLEELDVV